MATRPSGAAGRSPDPAGYAARDAAKLLDLSVGQIRAYVRAGFLAPRRGPHGEFRFSFQDLVLLRTGKALMSRLPARKVRRALQRLKEQLPRGRDLTGLRITAEGDSVVARDGSSAWVAESGQALIEFDVPAPAEAAPLAGVAADAARRPEGPPRAGDWYELACELEACDPDQAREGYARALALDPGHADAHVNLGRLLHESGDSRGAEAHYREALRIRPDHGTAAFDLGVLLEDLGRIQEALSTYQRVAASEPAFADAQFNLARLYESLGSRRSALRHLQVYRTLSRNP